MALFSLKVVTPDKVFFDGETEQVILSTVCGEIGILARHESYVSILPPGPLRIKIGNEFKTAAISQGLVKVSKDKTTIIATSVQWHDEIDIKRAKEAERKAREALSKKLNDLEFKQAEFKLKRAISRISISSKYNNK